MPTTAIDASPPQQDAGAGLAITLSPLKWAPATRAALHRVIAAHGVASPGYDPDRAPYAVFDWDNTCIMGDAEETLLRYMVDRFALRMTPAAFSQAIRNRVPSGPLHGIRRDGATGPVAFADLAADLDEDYAELAGRYGIPAAPGTWARLGEDPAFLSFRAKLLATYDAINDTYGETLGYRWIVWLFAGHTPESLATLAHASNAWHLGAAIAEVGMATPATRPGRAGLVRHTAFQCLRLTPEMADLHRVLRANGIEVHVCSASIEELIAAFATDPAYGYGLPRENIIGVRTAMVDGAYSIEDRGDWPLTYAAGKVEALNRTLVARKGFGPLMVFGDSNGDYDMMSAFADTRLSLFVNRLPGGNAGRLCREAAETIGTEAPRYVLQGRNEATGEWRPHEETIVFGAQDPRLTGG